ncbi:MAG: diaminopimelate decarboxylase [Actinobacteria bacterium]|nr:diaminopimelate decarboxylase [Actinomycetota bacterium]
MLFPVTAAINDERKITIGGCDVEDLKAKYATPLYIVDIATVKKQCSDYLKYFTFEDFSSEIIYASKAFCTIAMCQLIKQQGLSIDVSTGGELFIAIRSGFDPKKIYFHGNNKSIDEINFGIDYKVGTFIVDNFEELKAVNEIAGQKECTQNIMLRITPGIKAHTHKYIQTGAIESKFGFSLFNGDAMEAVKKASSLENINLIGLHAHIGSQIFNIEVYDRLIEVMSAFISEIKKETGIEITHLNIGGGLGIKYVITDEPTSIQKLSKTVHEALLKYTGKYGIKIDKIYLEPGRSIIGNAGVTLYESGTIKEIPGIKNYIAVDGGMSDNIRPILYQAKYEAFIATRADYLAGINDGELLPDYAEADGKSRIKYNIVGKHCESGDVIIEDARLPEVKRGDIILVTATGAYCYSMSSNYNGQPKNAVIAVEDGSSWIWVSRQAYEDLCMRDKKLYE